MARITPEFGQGGANLTPSSGSAEPDLATALRDVADDLVGVQSATITAPALAAFTDPPSAAEMALLRTLVNEIRAALIAAAATTIKTTKG